MPLPTAPCPPSCGLVNHQEDLIIPGSMTFYELIVNKARGKSGPLFSFDVHEDIRIVNDASKEKDETHAGKVMGSSSPQQQQHCPLRRWCYQLCRGFRFLCHSLSNLCVCDVMHLFQSAAFSLASLRLGAIIMLNLMASDVCCGRWSSATGTTRTSTFSPRLDGR